MNGLSVIQPAINWQISRSYSHTPSSLAIEAFFYVQGMGHFFCDENYLTVREGYKSFLLIYTVKGKGYVHYREKQYEIRKGQGFIMYCDDYQKYYSDDKDLWEIKWVHFYGGTSPLYFEAIYENNGPLIDIGEGSRIENFIDSLLEMKIKGDIRFEIKSSAIIMQILTDIMLSPGKESGFGKKPYNSKTETAIKFIEDNYKHEISLDDISRSACCNKFNFSRIFRKITGYSPYEYLIKHRINRSKSALKETDETVDQIASSVGFKSTSSYIKTFRELENITPLKYRKYWQSGGKI